VLMGGGIAELLGRSREVEVSAAIEWRADAFTFLVCGLFDIF
jgi:hypothetical protein